MNTLSIKNIRKTYANGVTALIQVSLEITNGMFGLLGPNGAGKSTLMRTIAALQEPDTGSITFNGVDILQEPDYMRKSLGYLPQEFGVYPNVSAYHLLDHIAVLKGILNYSDRSKQIKELLHQTNLWQHKDKAVSSFSGGMRQRFGIAQALLGNPKVIIADEPTAGLDPEERNRFHNLLLEIGEQVIVILSTHIVEDVRDLCPQMAIISEGSVLAQGSPDIFIQELQGKVWAKTLNITELAEQAHLNIISKRFYAGKTKIHALSDGKPGDGFELVTPDLEDVYFSTLFSAFTPNLKTAELC
ncbi:ABC transporter ATP-binding protein [Pontibacter sp. KCTC 32443]|nr:ABC transporter ATP-binding protein [Pontibacter sp. KCTC 32443]MBC5773128.1 ABC transporter ATP-binding protein [Pontibacter sp. KCTC 32443]